jgi:hypothetical protein
MKTIYRAHKIIHASAAGVWDAITEESFVKEFLPEVKKEGKASSPYIQATHQNGSVVLPSYAVKGQSIGWNSGAGKVIRLPRKDTTANIEAVDIHLDAFEGYTKVTIEVSYDPKFGKRFFSTRRCVAGLFNNKLNVLKQDIESYFKHIQWAPAKKQASWLNLWGCCRASHYG